MLGKRKKEIKVKLLIACAIGLCLTEASLAESTSRQDAKEAQKTSEKEKSSKEVSLLGIDTTAEENKGFDISRGFGELAEKCIPSVVNVSTTQIIENKDRFGAIPPFGQGTPFDDIFKDFFERAEKAPRRVQSLGTGFIVKTGEKAAKPYALVVTNYHVIAEAKKIAIVLHDNTELDAIVKATDERTDIALLEVDISPLPPEKRKLQVVRWGDTEKVQVGDWCVAIGNPFGLGSTVTSGLISNRARNIGLRGTMGQKANVSEYVDDFLQHSAAINMGNSGGPLFNLKGQVIGVNSAIFSPSGGNVGIGFAIPSNLVRDTVNQLIKYGHTRRGFLGVKIQAVHENMAESFGFSKERGAAVSSVTPNGPAAKAGIEPRDLILEFDGKEINDHNRLQRLVGETEIGKKVKVKILRKDKDGKDKEITLNIEIAELEIANSQSADKLDQSNFSKRSESLEVLGMKLSEITASLSRQFDLKDETKGSVILEVSPDSPAIGALKPGDVITEVNRVEVNTPKDIQKAVEQERAQKKRNVTFLINRGGEFAYVTIKNEEDLQKAKPAPKN